MDLRVAAYAVIVDDRDRMLLAHWNEARRHAWTLPGGGIEDGEDPVHTVQREAREETGYRVRVGALLGVHSRVIPVSRRISESDVPLHTLRIVYRASVIGGRLRNEVGGSTDRAEWFPLDRVRELRRVRLVDTALGWAGLSGVTEPVR